MKIYTKQGDTGQTGLYGGPRVSKDHLRIQAYGSLDELNAAIGVAVATPGFPAALREPLVRIQGELFQLGAELASPQGKSPGIVLVGVPEIERLESEIDAWEAELSPLRSFILPGGAPSSAALHLARTVARRGERELVALHHEEPVRDLALQYVNRISDHLFVAARFANFQAGVADPEWKAPRASG